MPVPAVATVGKRVLPPGTLAGLRTQAELAQREIEEKDVRLADLQSALDRERLQNDQAEELVVAGPLRQNRG